MGIQSWIASETKLLGRPQKVMEVESALEKIKQSKIPEINLDLIYGIYSQTKKSWYYSLEKTLDYEPTEIFLYPLYTRPLTGLSKTQNDEKDKRLEWYRIGRDFLKTKGYRQTSMRCFRKEDVKVVHNNYQSTKDGMIGIGAGARSYTKNLHYSTNYAVSRKATKAIIHAYSEREDFNTIDYGIYLNKEEQWRRFLIKSLIDGGSLDAKEFKHQFGRDISSIAFIEKLLEAEYLEEKESFFRLSEKGMELEDAIGPMLFSENTKKLMEEFEIK